MAVADPSFETPQNMNISAYRVLFILLMLVRYKSLNMMELNRFLSENPLIGRVYNSETLTKYINTLREVGCRIPRSSSRNDYSYELLQNPFPFALDASESSVAQKLLSLLAIQPDEALYADYREFLQLLAWSAEMPFPPLELLDGQVLPEHARKREQLRVYRAYCHDAFALDIQYKEQNQVEHLLLEPHEVVEQKNRLLLVGLERKTQRQKTLEVDRILSARQLPSKNRRQAVQYAVTFALYGRLAKSYRLYPDEKVVYRSETELHIKVTVAETSGLMARLLKYGAGCQVLAPGSFREAMRQHVGHLLEVMSVSVPSECLAEPETYRKEDS